MIAALPSLHLGTDVGDQRETARVVGRQRQQVLGRLHAGRLGAVLAEQEHMVSALAGEMVVDRGGDLTTVGMRLYTEGR